MLENKGKLEEFRNKKHPADEKFLNAKEPGQNNINTNKSNKNKPDCKYLLISAESESESEGSNEEEEVKPKNKKISKSANTAKDLKEDLNFTKLKRNRKEEKKESKLYM